MRFDELKQKYGPSIHKRHNDEEHRIQCSCIQWFRYEYPDMPLFAVPNGGKRDVITATRLKEEGAMAGVSDMILLKRSGKYNALCIEMKTSKGKQSQNQKIFQNMVEKYGCKYVICRSLDDFIAEVNSFITF